jgi:hypothetical protein
MNFVQLRCIRLDKQGGIHAQSSIAAFPRGLPTKQTGLALHFRLPPNRTSLTYGGGN